FLDHGLGRRRRRFRFVALHEHALLAHFDLDGARLARAVGLLDLGGLLAGERDLLVLLQPAVLTAQEVEQERLVLRGQPVAGLLPGDTGRTQLLEQHAGWHPQFGGKLFNGGLGHTLLSYSANQCARAFMISSWARGAGMPVSSVSSSTAKSARLSRVVT